MTNETHKIVTFKDIVEVITPENVLDFLDDFKACLAVCLIAKKNGVIIDHFTWCDDGKRVTDVKLLCPECGKSKETPKMSCYNKFHRE